MKLQRIRSRLDRSRRRPSLTVVLLALWILFIVYGTTLPFDFSASRHLVRARIQRLRDQPIQRGNMRADVVSNVLFFMPLGFLLAAWRVDRGGSFGMTMILATVGGALLSGSVEFAQLFSPKRTPSVLDLATNTLGSTVAAMIGWHWTRWLWPVCSVRIRQLLVARPLKACGLAAALGVVIAGVSPFNHAHDVIVGAGKGRPSGRASMLVSPTTLFKAGLVAKDLLTWSLAGGLFSLAMRESGRRGARAFFFTVAAAGGLGLAIEAVHAVIPGRDLNMTLAALAVLGSALGATAVARTAPGDAGRFITPALFLWCLVVVLTAWSPWNFAWPRPPFLTRERFVPFWSYFYSRTLADLADVVGQALLFLPLGALLAARSWRHSFLGAALIGLGLSFALEFGQVFLPARAADISDVISAAAGAGLGLALWRWGESARTTSEGVARYQIHPRTGLFG